MNEEPKPRAPRRRRTGDEYHFDREELKPDADKDPALMQMLWRGLRHIVDQIQAAKDHDRD